MLIAVLIILSSVFFPVAESWGTKSFKRQSLSDGGDSTCAVDPPDTIVPVSSSLDVDVGKSSAVPPGVRCAWICMTEANCTSYNHNGKSEMCEMFFYRPNKTLSDNTCTYFMVCFSHLNVQ